MMLTKIITTPKVQLLVIGGLPEDAENPRIILSSLFWGKDQNTQVVHHMPEGKWTSIGFLKDLSEDEAEKLVESYSREIGWRADKNKTGSSITLYRNYKLEKPVPVSMCCSTAKESLLSLIESEIKLKNKYGEHPTDALVNMDGIMYGTYKKWETEQSEVFTNPFIMIKK